MTAESAVSSDSNNSSDGEKQEEYIGKNSSENILISPTRADLAKQSELEKERSQAEQAALESNDEENEQANKDEENSHINDGYAENNTCTEDKRYIENDYNTQMALHEEELAKTYITSENSENFGVSNGKNSANEQDEASSNEQIWASFAEYCETEDFPKEYVPYVRMLRYEMNQEQLIIHSNSETDIQQLQLIQKEFEAILKKFMDIDAPIEYKVRLSERKTLAQMRAEVRDHPTLLLLQEEFGANLIRCSHKIKKTKTGS